MKSRGLYLLGILVILLGLLGPIVYSGRLTGRQGPSDPGQALSGGIKDGSASCDAGGARNARIMPYDTGSGVVNVDSGDVNVGSGVKKAGTKNTAGSAAEKGQVTGADLSGKLTIKKVPESNPPKNEAGVQLWVTEDFGRRSMYAETVGFRPGDAVLDILNQNLNIETANGGTFVKSINGVASGYTGKSGGKRTKKDWFYWVNGVMASVGADQYIPGPGDVIWWDYHDWSGTMFIPAVIGAYPEPFLRGYSGKNKGAVIFYADGYEDQAQKIKRGLEKFRVTPVSVAPFNGEGISKRNGPAMVVGPWTVLKQSEILNGMNERGIKSGLYVNFSDDRFNLLTPSGQIAGACGKGSGAIVAVGVGSGDAGVLWLVTGVDRQGLENAVTVLSERPQEIKYCFGAAVDSGKVIPLPIQ
ncbi:hypothetical protein Tfer_0212 [Thermincola ferriacetica]|uniref:Transcobalamin-like C-terminal domain-containing protein n=1 Tax=Thermincola ferriacetica TaxID=281456 RepID=A0A0L6W6I9_9FIRM|nr:DUF4430 domain-containing protein [Thermincola ferriacetica]KNZ71135.1 hypothetical protein Tfer_0212 [Thermincola ferriacetica]